MTYYGLTLNSAELGGDFHVNYMINGALEIVAYTFAMFIVERFGRKVRRSCSKFPKPICARKITNRSAGERIVSRTCLPPNMMSVVLLRLSMMLSLQAYRLSYLEWIDLSH